MTVRLTCYGAVGEIGGNKILLQDRGTKVFLDFGAGFTDGANYFSAGIEPRNVNGAGDYFEFDLLPELPGLYAEDALQNTELRYTEPEIDAVLLSHYHWDHMGRIDFVDEKIPVFCGETAKIISEAAGESGGSPLDDHEIRTFRTGDKLKIGNLEVVPVHVDHSIPGAYGFIIYTSEGAVVYTGDYRFHGPLGWMTDDFVREASQAKPLALITEGTRVSAEDTRQELTEADVVRKTRKIIQQTKKLVFSSFRGNDIDRVNSFYKACRKTERHLVVSMKTALLLEKLQKDRHLDVPKPGKEVLVYVRRKKTGTYDDSDYYEWERPFLDGAVNRDDVRKRQGELFLHLDVWHFPELIDIKPDTGGVYIHASSEAFNEEGEQEEVAMKNWANHFGFSYHHIHASGHAPIDKVRYLVRRIKANRTIPIHTEHPRLFQAITHKLLIPEKGKSFKL